MHGGGALKFNDVVQVLESDNRITTRFMNPDGGIYRNTEEVVYDDDSNSFNLGNSEDHEMTFLDALEDDLGFDDDNGLDLFQSRRYVCHRERIYTDDVQWF
jgi:hypothetical protein